jgi:hypothetical protein
MDETKQLERNLRVALAALADHRQRCDRCALAYREGHAPGIGCPQGEGLYRVVERRREALRDEGKGFPL